MKKNSSAKFVLKGVAKNSAEKDLASKLVNDIKGVKSVKNEMAIG